MKTVQRKGLNFEGQNVYIGIDVHKKILLSGKHFEKKKNGLDFGNEIQPFSFIFVLTKK